MKADVINNIYPTFYYQGEKYGVDFKGLLYNKDTLKIVSKDKAYQIYKHAYEKENIV